MEAVATAAGVDAPLPMGPFPERALRPLLATRPGSTGWRPRATRSRPRREEVAARARSARSRVRGDHRPAGQRARRATAAADGRSPTWTACAISTCTLGPAVLAELRRSLPPVLDASRWWCGRVFDRGDGAARSGSRRPLRSARAAARRADGRGLRALGPAGGGAARAAASLGAPATPSPTGRRRGTARPTTPRTFRSRRRSPRARGDFLIVLGDFHGGDNPLAQGIFGLRHPDPAALLRRIGAEAGPGRAPLAAAARRGRDDGAQLADVPAGRHRRGRRRRARAGRDAARRARGRRGRRTAYVSDRAGSFRRAARASSSISRSSSPRCAASTRSANVQAVRRSAGSSCAVRAGRWTPPSCRGRRSSPPGRATAGSPRRVFARSPLERKPRYVDFSRARAVPHPDAVPRRARRPSSSPRCCRRPSSAGCPATPVTTRANCAS